MKTKEKSLELPPLEKLALPSSETEDGAEPGRTLDFEGKEQKKRKVSVSEVGGTGGKDQAAESPEDKPGMEKVRVAHNFESLRPWDK